MDICLPQANGSLPISARTVQARQPALECQDLMWSAKWPRYFDFHCRGTSACTATRQVQFCLGSWESLAQVAHYLIKTPTADVDRASGYGCGEASIGPPDAHMCGMDMDPWSMFGRDCGVELRAYLGVTTADLKKWVPRGEPNAR